MTQSMRSEVNGEQHRAAQLQAIQSVLRAESLAYDGLSSNPANDQSDRAFAPREGSLGLSNDLDLDHQQLEALAKLENFDLSVVQDALISRGGRSYQWSVEAIFEFRRYLAIRLLYPEPISMVSKDVDEVWHACILFTRLYASLCDQVYGLFLHHEPAEPSDQLLNEEWEKFAGVHQHLFGTPGPLWQFWRPTRWTGAGVNERVE